MKQKYHLFQSKICQIIRKLTSKISSKRQNVELRESNSDFKKVLKQKKSHLKISGFLII